MKLALTTAIILFSFLDCRSQEFTKSYEDLRTTSIIRYSNLNAQLIIQKLTKTEKNDVKITYEIGLYLLDKSVGTSDFMNMSGALVFEDGSFITFSEPLSFNYLYSGTHQVFLKHVLSGLELKELQEKKIKGFKIAGQSKSVDRWESEKILAAANKIVGEPA